MIIVTNRNIQPKKSPVERFGKKPNREGIDELRLALATKHTGEWDVKVLPNKIGSKYASESVFVKLQEKMREQKKNCVLYVHGYNNDFEAALESAWDIQETYGVEVILFSWPANGRDSGKLGGLASYKSDKREAAASGAAFDRILEKLNFYLNKYSGTDVICDQRMTLFLHSMGNFLFESFVRNSSAYEGETAFFDNVVLCSADVNNPDHAEWLDRVQFRRSIYVAINENDFALAASRMKFGKKQLARLGHFTRGLNADHATYLDFTRAEGVGKSHSYFASDVATKNNNVVQTFKEILNGGRASIKMKYDVCDNAYRIA